MQLLIQKLITEIKENLCELETNYYMYQVGSSIYDYNKESVDLDILIVDYDSVQNRFEGVLEKLLGNFSSSKAYKHSVDATSEPMKATINHAISSYLLKHNNVIVSPHYCIGPYPYSPPPSGMLQIDVHVCGEFSIPELDLFIDKFPYIYLAFLNLNRCLLGPELETLVDKPEPGEEQYYEAMKLTATRGLLSTSKLAKIKAVKKVQLIKCLHENDPNSYQTMETYMRHIDLSILGLDKILSEEVEPTGQS